MKKYPTQYNRIFCDIYKNYKDYKFINSEYCKNYLLTIFSELYDIDINLDEIYEIEKKETNNRGYHQQEFRNSLIERYNSCIISNIDKDSCDAAHIYDLKYNPCCYDVNNGLLLSKTLHTEFDNLKWCINPYTYKVEIADRYKDSNLGINKYDDLDLTDKLSIHKQLKGYLIKKYNLFLNKVRN
jgi:hypothetical protein